MALPSNAARIGSRYSGKMVTTSSRTDYLSPLLFRLTPSKAVPEVGVEQTFGRIDLDDTVRDETRSARWR